LVHDASCFRCLKNLIYWKLCMFTCVWDGYARVCHVFPIGDFLLPGWMPEARTDRKGSLWKSKGMQDRNARGGHFCPNKLGIWNVQNVWYKGSLVLDPGIWEAHSIPNPLSNYYFSSWQVNQHVNMNFAATARCSQSLALAPSSPPPAQTTRAEQNALRILS
jgi:hypothetical protein